MAYEQGPYDREHGLLVWGGTLPGAETWSCSLRMAETEETVGANDAAGWDMPELLAHYSTILKAHHISDQAKINSGCKLTFVKFNRLDINGHYIDSTTFEDNFIGMSGALASPVYPNQIALVVSLTTARGRGPASKGRFYTPMPAVHTQVDGMISTGDCATLVARYKTTIEALSDVPGVDLADSPGAVVMSRKLGAPRTERVTGVLVGRVLDTQRRRRASLLENYGSDLIDQGTF